MTGRMYVLWVGIGGRGLFGAVIIGCVVYGIQLGWGGGAGAWLMGWYV